MKKSLLLNAIKNAHTTIKRFLLTFILALFGTILAIVRIEASDVGSTNFLIENLIFVCVVGIGLSIATTLFAERILTVKWHRYLLQLSTVLILGLYFISLPVVWSPLETYRAFILLLSLHCLVSFSAFIRRGNVIGFWQFNKTLFIHVFISILYTTVLFAGISLAIFSINKLFGITIKPKIYGELWVVLVGIFNTWFFLSGIPERIEELNEESGYPKGLKVFTQFILLPLVTIYFVILYIYLVKIIIAWELPRGIISYLVLAFSFLGILSLLLVYPLQNRDSESWIKIYSRWFYFALLPLVAVLFLAIGSRISQYGITESRYIIILLACWLAGISIYLLLTKLQKIKAVPISLCIVGMLSSFGPWGVFNVSKISQLNRLTNYLEKNGILTNGKIEKTGHSIDYDDAREINSIITYLVETHGLESMVNIISPELFLKIKGDHPRGKLFSLLELLNIENANSRLKAEVFSYSIPDIGLIYSVQGYDFIIDGSFTAYNGDLEKTYKLDDSDVFLKVTPTAFVLKYGNEHVPIDLLKIYEKFKHHLGRGVVNKVKSKDVEFVYEGEKIKFKMTPKMMYGNSLNHAEGFKVDSMTFWVAVKFK